MLSDAVVQCGSADVWAVPLCGPLKPSIGGDVAHCNASTAWSFTLTLHWRMPGCDTHTPHTLLNVHNWCNPHQIYELWSIDHPRPDYLQHSYKWQIKLETKPISGFVWSKLSGKRMLPKGMWPCVCVYSFLWDAHVTRTINNWSRQLENKLSVGKLQPILTVDRKSVV